MGLIRPPRLKPGDRVRLVSMSGTFPRSSWRFARLFAEALDLRLEPGRSLHVDPGYLGRDPERRADDFNRALEDDDLRAIFLFRGGNSAAEVLPHLDYPLLRRRPKVIAGFSDHTSVVLACHALSGVVTFLTPPQLMAPSRRNLTVDSFRRMVMERENGVTMAPLGAETWRKGTAQGPILAGNLAVLRNLLGTRYLPRPRNAIFCWEEVGEEVQDINAVLTQLGNAGLLEKTAGMVVGHLEDIARSESGVSLRELILARYPGRPVLHSRAFGHFRPCFTLPLGVTASLDGGRRALVVEQRAVE